MSAKHIRIDLSGEQGSGKDQLLSFLKEILYKNPQVINVHTLNSSKHSLLIMFEPNRRIAYMDKGVLSDE